VREKKPKGVLTILYGPHYLFTEQKGKNLLPILIDANAATFYSLEFQIYYVSLFQCCVRDIPVIFYCIIWVTKSNAAYTFH